MRCAQVYIEASGLKFKHCENSMLLTCSRLWVATRFVADRRRSVQQRALPPAEVWVWQALVRPGPRNTIASGYAGPLCCVSCRPTVRWYVGPVFIIFYLPKLLFQFVFHTWTVKLELYSPELSKLFKLTSYFGFRVVLRVDLSFLVKIKNTLAILNCNKLF